MKTSHCIALCVFAGMVGAVLLAETPAPVILCQDNGSNDLWTNSSSSDKTVSINPNNNSDADYMVDIVPSQGEPTSIHITDRNLHLFEVPPGGTFRVRDPQDEDAKEVEGAWGLQ